MVLLSVYRYMTPIKLPCGFLLLNKPANMTSQQCVAKVRRTYSVKRVGHGGTLDPDVTGALPVAIGSATRLLPYLPTEKSYIGEIQLGQVTSTDDLEGEILRNKIIPKLNQEEVDKTLEKFRGIIQQRPPNISAVHISGERAYTRARRGESMVIPLRTVTVYGLTIKHWEPKTGRLRFSIRCSSGTYIRSIARDLGEVLGCGGCLAWLQRNEALGFPINIAIPMKVLGQNSIPPLIDPLVVLRHMDFYRLQQEELSYWRCGRSFPCDSKRIIAMPKSDGYHYAISFLEGKFPLVLITSEDTLAGIAYRRSNRVHPRIVLEALG
uniref:tRNA pseudouridine(55) synthase n=1 Tax=Paulinella chromatophora TaxID=39717 RepID=B1X5A1_PAUCH|nr:putative tRNA pseudouridine 55 synthase [Paulinella chromatophora]ACB43120.1 putative tRNA pseudouridine 55 synthase [Paulinella chromatophora]